MKYALVKTQINGGTVHIFPNPNQVKETIEIIKMYFDYRENTRKKYHIYSLMGNFGVYVDTPLFDVRITKEYLDSIEVVELTGKEYDFLITFISSGVGFDYLSELYRECFSDIYETLLHTENKIDFVSNLKTVKEKFSKHINS